LPYFPLPLWGRGLRGWGHHHLTEEEAGKVEENTPESYMKETLALAAEGIELGELPIAAIVVLNDEIIARAITAEKREQRFLIHAEQLALEKADKLKPFPGSRRDVKLFTNLEPCLMCIGMAMSFFLGEIYYALESPADGAVDLVRNWLRKEDDMPVYQVPEITGGLLREESIDLFEQYAIRNPASPMVDWVKTLIALR
jgi:tRNA(adenine34) deaminase